MVRESVPHKGKPAVDVNRVPLEGGSLEKDWAKISAERAERFAKAGYEVTSKLTPKDGEQH